MLYYEYSGNNVNLHSKCKQTRIQINLSSLIIVYNKLLSFRDTYSSHFISKLWKKRNASQITFPEIQKTYKRGKRCNSRKKKLGYKIIRWETFEWIKGIQVGIALLLQFHSHKLKTKPRTKLFLTNGEKEKLTPWQDTVEATESIFPEPNNQ